MTTQDNNLLIHYDGDAATWQGGNRIEADHIEIDRENSVLRASGKVVSQFVDKPKKGKDGKPVPAAQPGTTFTVVRAPSMVYTDDDRLAHYTGGAVMTRPNMTVKAREIRAFLKDSQSDSSLDKAIADGLLSTAAARLIIDGLDRGNAPDWIDKLTALIATAALTWQQKGFKDAPILTPGTSDYLCLYGYFLASLNAAPANESYFLDWLEGDKVVTSKLPTGVQLNLPPTVDDMHKFLGTALKQWDETHYANLRGRLDPILATLGGD
jgi:lipopolysaccharide export system protein LptA